MEIQIKCQGNTTVDIESLFDMQGDLKDLSIENYQKLHDSIIKFGFSFPIFVWVDPEGKQFILDAHQRVRTLKKMRDEEGYIIPPLPADIIHADTITQAKEKLLLLNSSYGVIQQEGFDAFVSDIPMEDIADLLTIPEIMIEGQDDSETVEDEVPEVSNEPAISQLGQVYQLGRHRLMCGDATKIEDIERLMNGQKADMVFTDPPYGMFLNADFSGMKNDSEFAKEKGIENGKQYGNVIGDHGDFKDEFITTIFSVFPEVKEVFLWGANYYSQLLLSRNDGSWFVWDKREDENFDKMYGSAFELCWSKNKHKQEIIRERWASAFGTEQEFDHKRHHPTQKPIKLSVWFVEKFSQPEQNVVDLFGGSGSTLIACEQTNRTCYMMELDPKYCDVIRKRYAKFTSPDTWEQDWQSLTPQK